MPNKPQNTPEKIAIIIGAGPAGLTAAFELLTRTDIKPIVIEKSEDMGGLSRTVKYKGNRIDIGGHRFFSKSDRVMNWWLQRLPLHADAAQRHTVSYQNKSREIPGTAGPNPEHTDAVMLVRDRKTRIYFLRRFFDYPISLSKDTISKLGIGRTVRIGFSYLKSSLFPIRNEQTLEEFFINRFGQELYRTFFKDYTEKVWGVPCRKISAEWGAQRIKGLSVGRAIAHFVRSLTKRNGDIQQKDTETSLIERFLYPKLGPGQMWETVADSIREMGGEIVTGYDIEAVTVEDGRVTAVTGRSTGADKRRFEGDYFFSTMPVQELIRALETAVPENVREVSEGLIYRDFITVGLLLNKLRVSEETASGHGLIKDTWLYIQEPDVHVGRMQIFNNWSPYLVQDPSTVWIGLEYFCYENDSLWNLPDDEMKSLAAEEMDRIGILDKADVLDATVIRVPKTYPAYFGTYDRFDEVRHYLSSFPNLFLIGRNGMHKYNNQDHSMLTAMVAVDNIIEGRTDQTNIWAVNTEQDYHEEKS